MKQKETFSLETRRVVPVHTKLKFTSSNVVRFQKNYLQTS